MVILIIHNNKNNNNNNNDNNDNNDHNDSNNDNDNANYQTIIIKLLLITNTNNF